MNNYLATPADFEAIESALKIIWDPKLDFVFKDRTVLKKTIVVSYDSKFIYLWTPKTPPSYRLDKIPHTLDIPDRYHYAWCAGIWQKEIEDLLPSPIKNQTHFKIPRINGGLFTPFVTLQKTKGLPLNPYTTHESYLATIIHEFGHVYWDQFKLWWMSDKTQNLRLLHYALGLYLHRPAGSHLDLYLPVTGGLGEIFAFCTEYFTSSHFWPKYQKSLDKFISNRLKVLIRQEEPKNLDRETSVIEPIRNAHDFAFVYGKIILSHYPTTWPRILSSNSPWISL